MSATHYDEERGAGSVIGQGRKFFEMGTSSNSRSFEVESWTFVSHQNYSLQMMQKVEPPLDRNTIPATLYERLAFFRIFTSTAASTQKMSMSLFNFNRFMWHSAYNFLTKSLPINYLYLFLSSYVPNQHLYVPKMVPLMMGFNWLMVLAIITSFTISSESMSLLLHYGVLGFFKSNPWYRCEDMANISIVSRRGHAIQCETLEDFHNFSKSSQLRAYASFYLHTLPNGTERTIAPAPIVYYSKAEKQLLQSQNLVNYKDVIIIIVFIVFIGLFHTQMYRKTIWQVIHFLHWTINIFYLGAFLHIIVYSLETPMDVKLTPHQRSKRTNQLVKDLDYEMLADWVGVPPVLHFIASRTAANQISPAGNSALLVASNGLHHVLRGTTLLLLRRYCEHRFDITLVQVLGANVLFYLWPTYLSLIPLGELISGIFFLAMGLSEFLCFVITYDVGLESIESEWPMLKWWIVLIFTLPFTIVVKMLMTYTINATIVLLICVRSVMTASEMIIIVFLYPISRLEDDIIFHTGSPPSRIISIALRLLPVFFIVKLYIFVKAVIKLFIALNDREAVKLVYQMFGCSLIPLVIGALYAVIKIVFVKNQNWRALFRPEPQWGPRDHVQRQLRKQYDSREYIASTASRYLSRFLKGKLSSRVYRLDVCYEVDRVQRRSTVVIDTLRYDDEKKKDV